MATSSTFQTQNPTSLEILETYYYTSPALLEKTLATANQNWLKWKSSTVDERKQYLQSIAEQLRTHKEDLAQMMAVEMGKPLADGRAEVDKCVLTCDYYSENLASFLAGEEVKANYKKSWVKIESLGVILCVMPWNFPLWQVIRFAVPALSLGNTVVLKHSDITAGTAQIIEKVFRQSSGTEVFFNTPMTHQACADLLKDPRIKAVTFTGSERGGREVAKIAAENLKKSVMELGGSDAYLVLADADLQAAVSHCAQARLVNNGQSCVSGKRFFVPRKELSPFIEQLEQEIHKFPIGNPLDVKNKLGPLAQSKFKKDLEAQVAQYKSQASLHKILAKAPEAGAFFDPQVLSFAAPQSCREIHDVEFFGPVFLIFPYDSESEAMIAINSSQFGLGGAIFSKNETRALQLAAEFESGMVAINTSLKSDPRIPFGGVKHSGYGRELGRWGFYEFANIKTLGLG